MGPPKAAHYLRALDEARADGNWSAIPELVRKVRKHAPDRFCIALVAETECTISQATLTHASSSRPSTSLTAKDLGVTSQLTKLVEAIETETNYPEDKFQAKVCVGWLHWVVGEYSTAASRLPQDLDREYSQLDGADNVTDWTNVCVLKAAYLKANCATRNNERLQALYVFETGLPALTSVWGAGSRGAKQQLRYWAELFLTEYCMLASQALQRGEKPREDVNSLSCFRAWARYWEIQAGGPLPGGHGFRGSVPRRRIWCEYYTALSRVVEDDLPFPSAYARNAPGEHSARAQLRMELKRVENAYEALLLNETQFPQAEDQREEVEAFVDLVMKNWTVLCGRGWREHDLGQGGRETTSRGVLEILYRAATKTFHSTAILRHLFTVHLAVAEFELAFKAYGAYMDIVKKAKARVEKTGKPEPSLDDDATVLATISQCILALCRYGDVVAVERARDAAAELEDMLARLPQFQSAGAGAMPEIRESPSQPQIPARILAHAWQAIGLAHASWSRVTFDSASRTEIQTKAVRCLRKSLSPEFGRSRDVRGLFALSLLLAERRELASAIEIVKAALASGKSTDAQAELVHGPYWQERALISLWHLLGLLLSARQDYATATKALEAAFEQFKDPSILWGNQDHAFRSDHLNEAEARSHQSARRGVVDEMDGLEKEAILELKMTQLALLELVEGPEAAVNESSELLTLYARLFGAVQDKPAANSVPPKTSDVPKSSAGTLRSIKGSIFGRHSRTSAGPGDAAGRQMSIMSETAIGSRSGTARPLTTQTTASTAAPTIQITQENGHSVEVRPQTSGRRSESSRRRNSLRKRDPSRSSRRRAASSGPAPTRNSTSSFLDGGESVFTPDGGSGGDASSEVFAFANRRQASIASTFSSRGRTLPALDSYLSTRTKSFEFVDHKHGQGAGAGIGAAGLDAYSTMPSPLPLVQFAKEEEHRRRSALLVGVWLMVGGFYRRAGMHADCAKAVSEAQKIVQGLEAEGAREGNGALNVRGSGGWGEKKSVEELWGDIWAELGNLALAKGKPYVARGDFESALTYFPNHPAATVGLSNVLLDIYTEEILPPPSIPQIEGIDKMRDPSIPAPSSHSHKHHSNKPRRSTDDTHLPCTPLGLASTKPTPAHSSKPPASSASSSDEEDDDDDESQGTGSEQGGRGGDEPSAPLPADHLPPPHKATSLPLVDRFAARDRAYGLLSGLTRLGRGWNDAQAWFALARAHEESGRADKAREALWWCVELEEGSGVRGWSDVGAGGYIIL